MKVHDLDQMKRRRKEAELLVIAAAAFCPNETAHLLTNIDAGDFEWEEHADYWRRTAQTFDEHGKVSLVLVNVNGGLQEVSDAARALKGSVTSPHAPDPLVGFRAVLAMCDLHRQFSAMKQQVTQLPADAPSVRDFADAHEFSVKTAVQGIAPPQDPRSVAELAVEGLRQSATSWIATYGIRALDRATAGLRPGTFHVIIAPTAHGKSALALTAAFETALRGLRVLYVTKEMSRWECSLRWAAMATGEKRDKLEARVNQKEELLPRLTRLIPKDLCPRDDLSTPMAIAAEVQRAEIEGNAYKLVVVDYLQQYPGPGNSATERIDSCVDMIKTMALQRGCAVIAPAQMNRDQDEGSIPQRSNIRGSGAIEQWADVVIAMRKQAENLYTLDGQPHFGDAEHAAAVGMQMAIRKARNAQECTLWGEGNNDVGEALKMGVGTFRLYDSKHAPYAQVAP